MAKQEDQQKQILDMLYALVLKHNLIHVVQLTKKWYHVIFKGEKCFIYHKPPTKNLIVKIQMTMNKMYILVMTYAKHYTSLFQIESYMDD